MFYGDYADCCAGIEFAGLPMDTEKVELFLRNREAAKHRLTAEYNRDFQVFDTQGSLRNKLVWDFAAREKIPWPATDHGAPKLDDDTLKSLGMQYPRVITTFERGMTLLCAAVSHPTLRWLTSCRSSRLFISTTRRATLTTAAPLKCRISPPRRPKQ